MRTVGIQLDMDMDSLATAIGQTDRDMQKEIFKRVDMDTRILAGDIRPLQVPQAVVDILEKSMSDMVNRYYEAYMEEIVQHEWYWEGLHREWSGTPDPTGLFESGAEMMGLARRGRFVASWNQEPYVFSSADSDSDTD